MIEEKINLFNEGGLRDDGGETSPTSGNKVPSGSLKEEVADDIPVMMSEGEFVFPADVVRYIGLETLMKMRQDAKQGLKMMEEMGQMGNSEEATIPDDVPFEMADLIVVSGSKPKKMQSGGLLDDPRFQRPEGGGGTPTITDEDRKEMEDALLRTGYGNVVMKRYVNADGDVKYIPFINGEPQMEIPEGYELDESAPKTESNIGGSGDSGGGGDSGGPADSLAPVIGSGAMQTFEKPKIMVDGKEYTSIDAGSMDTDTLIKYYKQFDSPIYRYAATGAALFFSPLAGLAIMAGQTLSNKNSPTGLNAVQAELQRRKLSAEQRKSVLTIAESLRKNGAGGIGSIGKKILQGIGLLSNTEQGQELTDFEKAIKSGNTSAATKAASGAVGANSNSQKLFADASREGFQKYITEGGMGMDIDKRETPQQTGVDLQRGFQNIILPEQGPPIEPVVAGDPALGLPTIDPTASGTVDSGDPSTIFDEEAFVNTPVVESQKVEATKRLGDQDIDEQKLIADQVDRSEESAPFRLPRSQFQPDYGFSRVDQIIDQQKRTKDRRTLGDKIFAPSEKKFGIETDPKITQTPAYRSGDDDRDDGGPSSGIDDFFGSDFGQPSQPTFTPTTTPVYTSQTAGGQQRPQTFGVPSTPSIGTGGGGGGQRFGPTGGFYVGGVPTKPMKPQRLKKGGLAKSKVKPKRMKKGGLASRKK